MFTLTIILKRLSSDQHKLHKKFSSLCALLRKRLHRQRGFLKTFLFEFRTTQNRPWSLQHQIAKNQVIHPAQIESGLLTKSVYSVLKRVSVKI